MRLYLTHITLNASLNAPDSETARTSVFLGQCYVDPKGEETLHALWLLREAADSPADDWKGTR